AVACATAGPLVGGIHSFEMIGWLVETKPSGSVLDNGVGYAHTGKTRTTAGEELKVLTRTKDAWFDADKMPDVCGLLRMIGIDADGSTAHLVGQHERADEAGKDQGVDAWSVPSFAKQRLGTHQDV